MEINVQIMGDACSKSTERYFLCFVTNGGYAPGAVCLAQSLLLVGSCARLRVIATSIEARDALLHELESSPTPLPPPMDVILEETTLPSFDDNGSDEKKTHNGSGATLAVDAPRRCLFDDKREGWILLDADLVCISNPDSLFDILDQKQNKNIEEGADIYASANFRMKKKAFGSIEDGGNFNAGMMVVPKPKTTDGDALQQLVNNATDEDTEELLLNTLFKGRCSSLKVGYNVPKRVFHHAPLIWKDLVENKEIIFLHYMGCKPWMTDIKKRIGADWESEMPAYKILEIFWWKVKRDDILCDDDGTLHGSLPLEVPS